MFNWNKKEAPLLGLQGLGGGLGYLAGAGAGAVEASGGTVIPAISSGNGYKYHVYSSTGPQTFSVTAGGEAEILIVAGGGGGGAVSDGMSGGGGAGGVIHYTTYPLTVKDYAITVGTAGNDSQFDPTSVAKKGGSGGNYYRPSSNWTVGEPGGSGGGGSQRTSGGPGIQPSQPLVSGAGGANWGYSGAGGGGPDGGGGGGGSGSDGGPYSVGGDARAFPSFPGPIISPGAPRSPVVGPTGLFGGGGSGGPGTGGSGGGGPTGSTAGGYGSGGGGQHTESNGSGGPGSSGIVIVRYLSET